MNSTHINESNWQEVSDLIDHVVTTHHSYLKSELPILNQFVSKIARVHGPNDGEMLYELEKYYQELMTVLEEHIIMEEETLFPQVKEMTPHPTDEQMEQLLQIISNVEKLHDQVRQLLQKMREVTSNYTLPAHACRTYTATFTKLEELETDLFTHLQLESAIMLPRIISTKNLNKFV